MVTIIQAFFLRVVAIRFRRLTPLWHSTHVTAKSSPTGSSPAASSDSSTVAAPGPQAKLLFGIAIFASAFCLFQVEPIIAKMILPWFGGVAAVWAVCLVFFQTTLLLGYLYAHVLTRRFSPRAQGRIHATLLIASLIALRIVPHESWRPAGPEHPALRILFLLAATVGIPFFLLSATSPLLQAWYAKTLSGARPYRLYAVSNAGSMLALVTYPVAIEPWISTSHQAFGWSAAYVGTVLLCAAIALTSREREAAATGPANIASAEPAKARVPATLQLLWLALAACSSALLLAVTNHIAQNIASVPFLWLLPLSLYLLSFILCFDARGWYRPGLFLRLLGIAIGGMAYALAPSFAGLPWKVMIVLFCAGFFVCCMFCHGELERLKPAPERLTNFYLLVALGGATGAVFAALVAPEIFSGYYELHVGLGLCAILVFVVHYRDPGSPFNGGRRNPACWVLAGLVAAVLISLFVTAREQAVDTRLMARNFYGVLRVIDEREPNVVFRGDQPQWDRDPRFRKLMNGTIDHGLQFLNPARSREPTTYYGRNSGVGVALRAAREERALHVGAIGLGIGTVATYGRAGDSYTFYEINPLVLKVAEQEFTFLRDSAANVKIVLGDGRLSLEREQPPQRFDVLIVDAFSGDSIPVHLLTREAFQLYFGHLKPDGVLAVHVSNQYLNLEPVVAAAASRLGKEAVIVNHEVGASQGVYPSTWILLGSREGFLGRREIENAGEILPAKAPMTELWTDDYSSLWRVLK
ncbi:MAG TPA: fused MFS/spermidine synthase [Candidatus Acidoferrales bacterium]|nr:fused MFS/spermidine synthase [Candidatus Acidoferrales bacterium]